jgi:hypothetical protein
VKRVATFGAALLTTVTATGCGSMEIHQIMFRSAANGSHEAVLYVESAPTRPFVEVGLLQAIGSGDQASTAHVLEALRAEGKRQGCDAIVLARAATGNVSAHASGMCVLWAR